jgi:uncharacterized protein YidB (DUF937 family)
MGLFDSIVGAVEGQVESAAGSNNLLGAVGGILTQSGGLQGLQQKFSENGLEGAFSSWVGTEANQAISPAEIEKVLGSGQINDIAAKLGIDPATASSFLAEHLPKIVDKLTPTGQVDPSEDHQSALASLIPSLLQSFQGSAPAAQQQ